MNKASKCSPYPKDSTDRRDIDPSGVLGAVALGHENHFGLLMKVGGTTNDLFPLRTEQFPQCFRVKRMTACCRHLCENVVVIVSKRRRASRFGWHPQLGDTRLFHHYKCISGVRYLQHSEIFASEKGFTGNIGQSAANAIPHFVCSCPQSNH